MAYLLFLLATAALFVRPAELFPSLGDVQIYMALIGGAILCSATRIHNQLMPRTMIQQPINLCVAGMFFAVLLSHLSRGQLDAAAVGGWSMLKVALYYFTLVSVINTPLRLRRFLCVAAVCSSAMIAAGVRDYRDFVPQWEDRSDIYAAVEHDRIAPPELRHFRRHIPDRMGVTPEGDDRWVFRLCGFGIFHDPNDLALLITVTSVIAVYFLTDPAVGMLRWLWTPALALMAYAYYLTYSRGGLLAMGMALVVWLATKYGRRAAVALGAVSAAAISVVLGRHAQISLSSGTGQERLRIWTDGLVQLQSPRILFGTGESTYHDLAGLVAHNSYVHSFVELGFFGGTLFFGCFFIPAYTIYRLKKNEFPIPHPELRRMLPFVAAIIAGWCMGMASLSRCYVVPTYLIAGVAAAYLNLTGYYRPMPRPLLPLCTGLTQRWLVGSAGLLMCCFLFVKMFARFGS